MDFLDYDIDDCNAKSMFCLGGAWIVEFAYLLIVKILGEPDSSVFFAPIIEWIFVLLLIASLVIGGISDIIHAQFTNIITIVSVCVILRLLLGLFVSIGFMALFGVVAIIFFAIAIEMTFGGSMTFLLAILADAFGILPLILLVVFLIGAIIGGFGL